MNRLNSATLASIIATTVALTGCLGGPGFLKQEGSASADAGAISAPVVKDAAGVVTAQVAAGSGVSQRVAASSSSAVAGSSVVFPPGSLAISTAVTIQQGSNIASPALASQLGLATGNSLSAASNSVVVSSSSNTDAASPFTVALALSSGGNGLLDTSTANLIVIYTVIDAATGTNLSGIIPTSQLTVVNGTISFQTVHFGQYQAAYATQPVTAPVSVTTTAPVLTQAAVAQLSPVTWQSITGTYNGSGSTGQLSVAVSATGFTSLVSCLAEVAPSGSTTPLFSSSLGANLSGNVTMPEPANGKYQVQISCTETNGRFSTSPWSAAFVITAPVAASPASTLPSQTASTPPPVATLSGLPALLSNQGTLSVIVGGNNVAQYSYAVTSLSNSCSGASYSAWVSVSTLLTTTLNTDGHKTLCVLGRSASGTQQSSPSTYTWTLQTAPLTVTNTGPANGAQSIPATGAAVFAQFSAPIQQQPCPSIALFEILPVLAPTPNSAPGGCGTPTLANGLFVPGSQSLIGGTKLTLTPSVPLALNAPYTAMVASNIADLAGNIDGTVAPWTFTTADGSWSSTVGTGALAIVPGSLGTGTVVTASGANGMTVAAYLGASDIGVYATYLAPGATSWSTPVQLDGGAANSVTSLTATVDTNGNIMVLWVEGNVDSGSYLYSNSFNASSGQWSYIYGGAGAPMTVFHLPYASGVTINDVSAAVDAGGSVHVAWYACSGGSSYGIGYSQWRAGSGWLATASSVASLSSPASTVQLSTDPAGDSLVVWSGATGVGLMAAFASSAATTWSPHQLSSSVSFPFLFSSLDGGGNAFVVWQTSGQLIYDYLPFGVATWNTQGTLTTSSPSNTTVATNAGGQARVAWYYSSGLEIESSVFNQGILLNASPQVIQSVSYTPTLAMAMDPAGDSALAWYTSASSYPVYAVALPSGNTSAVPAAAVATVFPTSNTYPTSKLVLSTDPVGNATLMFSVDTGTNYQVYASRLARPATMFPAAVNAIYQTTDLGFTPLGGGLFTSSTGTSNFVFGGTSNDSYFEALQFK